MYIYTQYIYTSDKTKPTTTQTQTKTWYLLIICGILNFIVLHAWVPHNTPPAVMYEVNKQEETPQCGPPELLGMRSASKEETPQ